MDVGYLYKDCLLGKILGQGAYGVVCRALHCPTGEFIAIKEVKLTNSKSEARALARELDLLRTANHENIVRILGYQQDPASTTCQIMMEYCAGGSLGQMLQEFGVLPEHLASRYVAQCLRGLDYLHSRNIVHRDIKPQNVLVDPSGLVKVADFGTAKRLSDATASATGLSGTPSFMSPELVRSQVSPKSDIWALGCSVLELLTGKKPWWHLPDTTMFQLIYHIGTGREQPTLPKDCTISDQARNFIYACLELSPVKRPSAPELLDHPWIRNPATPHPDSGTNQTRILEGSAEDPSFTLTSISPVASPGSSKDSHSSIRSFPTGHHSKSNNSNLANNDLTTTDSSMPDAETDLTTSDSTWRDAADTLTSQDTSMASNSLHLAEHFPPDDFAMPRGYSRRQAPSMASNGPPASTPSQKATLPPSVSPSPLPAGLPRPHQRSAPASPQSNHITGRERERGGSPLPPPPPPAPGPGAPQPAQRQLPRPSSNPGRPPQPLHPKSEGGKAGVSQSSASRRGNTPPSTPTTDAPLHRGANCSPHPPPAPNPKLHRIQSEPTQGMQRGRRTPTATGSNNGEISPQSPSPQMSPPAPAKEGRGSRGGRFRRNTSPPHSPSSGPSDPPPRDGARSRAGAYSAGPTAVDPPIEAPYLQNTNTNTSHKAPDGRNQPHSSNPPPNQGGERRDRRRQRERDPEPSGKEAAGGSGGRGSSTPGIVNLPRLDAPPPNFRDIEEASLDEIEFLGDSTGTNPDRPRKSPSMATSGGKRDKKPRSHSQESHGGSGEGRSRKPSFTTVASSSSDNLQPRPRGGSKGKSDSAGSGDTADCEDLAELSYWEVRKRKQMLQNSNSDATEGRKTPEQSRVYAPACQLGQADRKRGGN